MSAEIRHRRRPGSADESASNHHHLPESDCNSEPRPVQIVETSDNHTFTLKEQALREILLSDEVCNRKVVVVSVAGALRKGKSFLLDYFLRFLIKGGLDGGDDWMGNDDEPLSVGFSWRHGCKRDTSGILLWSQPFITKLPNSGEEVAILLLDTEGAFDHRSTVEENTIIFALSTMISSVQVYNLASQIQENDLQHLNLFTEYGKLAMIKETKRSTAKPFQSLCFLVRDWSFEEDHPLGLQGGQSYLNEKFELQHREDMYSELGETRDQIDSYFEKVFCFLMPHPGFKVSEEKCFDGRLSDIRIKFKDQLKDLAPLLLSPQNLVVKKINGTPLTGHSLFKYFKAYMTIFMSGELPTPRTILETTATLFNPPLIDSVLQRYKSEMENVFGYTRPFVYAEDLEKQHKTTKNECVEYFILHCMGTRSIKKASEHDLCEKINVVYQDIKKRNNIRRYVTLGAVGIAGATGVVGVGALAYAAGGVIVSSVIALSAVVLRFAR